MDPSINASLIRRLLGNIDLANADVLQVEKDIYEILSRSAQNPLWVATPIPELSEPIDFDALVLDLSIGANTELRNQAKRVDTIYDDLSRTNNEIKMRLETIENLTAAASTALAQFTHVQGVEAIQYQYIVDTFNSETFVDMTRSSVLVDTDYGGITLPPKTLTQVPLSLIIDTAASAGVPGANMLVTQTGFLGSTEKEPEVSIESTETRSLSSILDADPMTWFEIERNFIPPKQKMVQNGRSFRYSEAGQEKDVLSVTKDLDWKVFVQWGESEPQTGGDGKGIPIAEFIDLGQELRAPQSSGKYAAKLAFEAVLNEPQPLSMLRLAPFTREQMAEGVNIESISLLSQSEWIDVARNIELGTNRSTTRLEKSILRRTGTQTLGSLIHVPTDRDIERIRIVLSSNPAEAPQGLAHPFRDFLHWHRSERNHGLWRSADTWRLWLRDPINKTPPTLIVPIKQTTKTFGSLVVPGVQTGLEVGYRRKRGKDPVSLLDAVSGFLSGQKSVQNITGDVKDIGTASDELKGASGTGIVTAASNWLGSAFSIVSNIANISTLISTLFSYSHDEKIEDGRQAWDVFKGWRASVGIRDLQALRVTYESEGTLVSIKRKFARPVSKIGLFVSESVPTNWGPGDWFTYYISVDGDNWLPVPLLEETTLERSLALETPTDSVYLRCDIKGNPDDPERSPILEHCTLEGLPA